MEANDNREGPGFEDRKAFLMTLVKNLEPGADGRAGMGAIIRELEQMRPGLVDCEHARMTASRLSQALGETLDLRRIDWSAVDHAGA